jgi:lysylphosphatidylglycerol synthetase-like protein (DUF2156 family)
MGKRSRKRGAGSPGRYEAGSAAPASRPDGEQTHAVPARPRPRREREPVPPAPWGSFPLSELAVLIALVLAVLGLIDGGRRGTILLGCALALGSIGGLEVAIREHFAGRKSHSTVLAGAVAVASLGIMLVAGAPLVVKVAIAAGVFAAAFWAFREAFKRRSGGRGFR